MAVFAVQVVVRGNLTVFDGVLLLALYVLYARRVQGTPDEEPAVVGVAAGLLSLPASYRRPAVAGLLVAAGAVVITIANPFTQALLATGASLGIDPYLMIQSVVPASHRGARDRCGRCPGREPATRARTGPVPGGLGEPVDARAWVRLPIAYLAGGGGISLPLATREQLELGFTTAVTLFVVAALATMRPERVDAILVASVFVAQLVWPTPFLRFAAAFVLMVFAIDLLVARRRGVGPMLRAAFGRTSDRGG